jgi:hypothetical protein
MYEFPEDRPQYLLIEVNGNRAEDCNWHSALLKRKLNEYLKPTDVAVVYTGIQTQIQYR